MSQSRYAELWNTIKTDAAQKIPKGVTIAAHPALHKRIIKAIQNRKLRDSGYKFLMSDMGKGFCKLEHTIEGNTINFSLKFSLTEGDL